MSFLSPEAIAPVRDQLALVSPRVWRVTLYDGLPSPRPCSQLLAPPALRTHLMMMVDRRLSRPGTTRAARLRRPPDLPKIQARLGTEAGVVQQQRDHLADASQVRVVRQHHDPVPDRD